MNKAPIEIAKKSRILRVMMRKTRNALLKARYNFVGVTVKVDSKLMVFGSYNGKSYSCSPKAVYEYLINNDEYADLKFVWLFDEPEKYKFLEKNRNTVVVKNKSKECEKFVHCAKYWVFNYRASDYWTPNSKQYYVQCWHGTPLKKLGYDISNSDNAMNSLKEIRSKYRYDSKKLDYMVSPCDFVTDKFITAWNLEDLDKENAILEIGYPRNDYLVNFDEKDIDAVKQNLGIADDKRKVILYAPTWRDNQHDAKTGYTYDNPVDFDYLKEKLGDEYIILFRAHYLVANGFNFDSYKGFVYDVSAYDDINELYIVSDLLVTDYSSVFFDYALLNRPMLFYMYDMEQYRDELRGFYIDINELPGDILKTEQELVKSIKNVNYDSEYNKNKLEEFNKQYNSINDGKASERLVNALFHKKYRQNIGD